MPSHPANRRLFMLASLGVLAAFPALADGVEPMLTIRGELAYRQRIALPGNAVAIVELKPEDAPDGASVTAEARIALGGRQVPVAFALEVPRAHLDAGKTYVLRGAIEADSEVRWLSGPVTIDTAARSIDVGTLMLSPYEAPPPFGIDGKVLIGGKWRIAEVGGRRIEDDIAATIGFGEDGAFFGRLCNSYRGAYTLDGASISFGNAAATLMACPEPQATHERALFQAFEQAKSWRTAADGKTLTVRDGDGKVLILARK